MKFVLERITGPEFEPVTLAEAKRFLREFATVTDNDTDISDLITAAREWAEDFTGRVLIEQTWKLTIYSRTITGDAVKGYTVYPGIANQSAGIFNMQASGEIWLRKSPALSIAAVKAVDLAGVETDVTGSTYELREPKSKWPRLVSLNGSPWTSNMLRITYRAGFADTTVSPQDTAAVVPIRFKQAIKLWLAANYDCDKDQMVKLLDMAERILKPERVELQIA